MDYRGLSYAIGFTLGALVFLLVPFLSVPVLITAGAIVVYHITKKGI